MCCVAMEMIFNPIAMVERGWSGDPMCFSTADSICSNWDNGGRLSDSLREREGRRENREKITIMIYTCCNDGEVSSLTGSLKLT